MDFFLRPDFSALARPGVWSAAFGQAFFSLSVGMGILITYGAYMPENTDIGKSALIITISDITAALLAGIAIFSLVFTFGLQPTAGAELAFTTLPKAFELMPYGSFFSIAFFALLFSAALTSAISMMEVNVASIIGETGMTRRKASLILTIILIITGLAPALSYSQVDLRFQGLQILDLMDETVGTMGLPIAAFLVALIFKWFMKSDVQKGMTGTAEVWLCTLNFLTKYAIPAVLLIITISTLIGL
jgi:NSS family neurotransmitter:Na+ symporter